MTLMRAKCAPAGEDAPGFAKANPVEVTVGHDANQRIRMSTAEASLLWCDLEAALDRAAEAEDG